MKRTVDIMLDSGAFSAWRTGEVLDLDTYMNFIERNGDMFYSYVTMDTIPGTKGVMRRSQEEIEISAKLSYKNQQRMKREGFKPIPVFHQGERWRWLEQMIDEGEDYIGISPYQHATKGEIWNWLEQVFTKITNDQGLPVCKTHGFGVTSQRLLLRYPWFSCDSTFWLRNAAYGKIVVPVYFKGKADYTKPYIPVLISGRAQNNTWGWKRYESLGSTVRGMVDQFLKERLKATVQQVKDDIALRQLSFIWLLQEIEKQVPKKFAHSQHGFGSSPASSRPAIKLPPARVFFAGGSGKNALALLQADARNRLVSYYDIRKASSERLATIAAGK